MSLTPAGRTLIIGEMDKSLSIDESFLTAMDTPSKSPNGNKNDDDDDTNGFKTPRKETFPEAFKFSILQDPCQDCVGNGQAELTPEGEDDTERLSLLPIDVIDATSIDRSIAVVSPLAAEDSVRTRNQHTIDLSLQMDAPANSSLVYIKSSANTSPIRDLVHDTLLDFVNPLDDGGGRIVAEYDISSEMIDSRHLVDKQFGRLARHAMQVSGVNTSVSSVAFQEAFGEELEKVKQEKRIYNAREALSALACDPLGLEQAWHEAERDSSKGKIRCFGNDLYCGNLYLNQKNIYVINGFYMATRGEYLQPDTSIHAFVVEWSRENLSWKDFMSKVIGAKDPTKAEIGSLQQIISSKYRELGLDSAPTEVDNVIHASASPLEGLSERMNWCSRKVYQDDYGRILLGRGIPESRILDWVSGEAVVDVKNGGKMTNVFDLVKDMDSKECADKLTEFYDYELFGPGRKARRRRCQAAETNCCTIS